MGEYGRDGIIIITFDQIRSLMIYFITFIFLFALVPDKSIRKYKWLYGNYWLTMMVIKVFNLLFDN